MRFYIKRKIIETFIIILIPILIISSCLLIHDFKEYKENKDSNEELVEEVYVNENGKDEINWKRLKEINPDIIAWIKIDDTEINYPILKDNSKLYYLNHTFDKKYNSNGSVFTLDDRAFEDNETLIFGHNMRNKTMFSTLDRYMNQEYFYSHLKLHIYTPKIEYSGEIFSAYSIAFDKENSNIKELDFEERLEYYNNASKFRVQRNTGTKKIVKLSTCSYINAKTRPTDQRYYIIATLVENDGGRC